MPHTPRTETGKSAVLEVETEAGSLDASPAPVPADSAPRSVRNTRQKEAIRAAIQAAGRPLSPEEILLLAQETVQRLSLATVYRNIASLQRDGWLSAVTLPGMPARYEVAGKAHHHHFHCSECGKVYELEGCGFEFHAKLPKGFMAAAHELLLLGRCAACN